MAGQSDARETDTAEAANLRRTKKALAPSRPVPKA